jgi:hypothetical protein
MNYEFQHHCPHQNKITELSSNQQDTSDQQYQTKQSNIQKNHQFTLKYKFIHHCHHRNNIHIRKIVN